MMRQRIEEAIAAELPGASFVIERPRDMRHGDYSTNAALVAKIDANDLAAKLKIDGVEKIEVVGKFINFFISPKELRSALMPGGLKIPQLNAGKTIMVEYTDPNPFKEFHIGHLMSNAIGEAIARLLEATGAKVLRANYQGDVGPHVAKAIWALLQMVNDPLTIEKLGIAYTVGNEQYEANKEEVDALNKKIYDRNDSKINELYDEGRKLSLQRFEIFYNILGTKFDYYFFERETGPKGLALVKAHPEVFEQSDGAVVFHGEHTRVFITSLGLPTYETKDLGLLELKKEKASLDESITVTANEQNDYFKVVLAAATRLSEIADIASKTQHVSHGMMRFAQGKMSSRTGNVITGESLLGDLIVLAHKKMQGRKLADANKIAEGVAVGAIKYTVLKQGTGKDIIFNPEQSLSLEGDSGPYLQYALVRARSLLKKAEAEGLQYTDILKDVSMLYPPEAAQLERVLIHYPEVVERAARELEPHYLTTYLTELAGSFNSWYASNRVIGGDNPHFGVFLASAVEHVLREGLETLGIPTPEEM